MDYLAPNSIEVRAENHLVFQETFLPLLNDQRLKNVINALSILAGLHRQPSVLRNSNHP